MRRLPRLVRRVLSVAAGAALLLFFFRDVLGSDTFLLRRDAFRLYLPLWQFIGREARAGHLPTWFPDDGLGVSAVGSSMAALLHPLTWLVLILPPDQALKWAVLAAYPTALGGMVLLTRQLGAPPAGRWLAGLAYTLCGYLLSVSDNPPYVQGHALLPWVALSAELLARRPGLRPAAGLALSLALTMWGGDIQGVAIQLAVAIAIVASRALTPRSTAVLSSRTWRERALGLGGAFGLFGLLGAPLWGPVWATFRESGRSSGLSPEEAMTWAVHPIRLLELAIGSFVPSDLIGGAGWDVSERYLGGHFASLWSLSEFVGTATLACAALAVFVRRPSRRLLVLYGGMAVVGLLMALGSRGGLYSLFYDYLPLGKAFRYPEKMMPLPLLGLCALSGWGVRALHGRRRGVVAGLALAGAGLLIASAAIGNSSIESLLRALDAQHADPDSDIIPRITQVLTRGLTVSGVELILLAILATRGSSWGVPLLQYGQALLTCGWVFAAGPSSWMKVASPFIPTIEHDLGTEPRRICRNVPGYHFEHPPDMNGPDPAQLSDVLTLAPDQGARWSIGSAHPYLPGFSRALSALCAPGKDCGTDCSRAEGVKEGIVSTAVFEELKKTRPELREVQRQHDPEVVLFEDPSSRGFAALPGVHFEPSEAAAQAALDDGRFDRATQVVAVGPGPDLPPTPGTVSVLRPSGNHLDLELSLGAPGSVVISESCLRGWQASLDRAPAELKRANLALCRVQAPAGRHHLELQYTPPTWPWSFALYALGWAGVIAAFGWKRRSRASLVPSPQPSSSLGA